MKGTTLPALHVLMSKWAPPAHRTAMVMTAFSGSLVGSQVARSGLGILCGNDCVLFPAFCVAGAPPPASEISLKTCLPSACRALLGARRAGGLGLGLVWSVAWCVLVYDSPLTHFFIRANEQRYLQHVCDLNTGQASVAAAPATILVGAEEVVAPVDRTPTGTGRARPSLRIRFLRFPVRAALTSLPFTATIVAHMCFNWSYFSVLPAFIEHLTYNFNYFVEEVHTSRHPTTPSTIVCHVMYKYESTIFSSVY